MIRTQVSLEAGEMDQLRALARSRGVSIAFLLRQAVGALLRAEAADERRARLLALSGKYDAGRPVRWSEEHDDAFEDGP
ncbi:MAG: ribbon-helix-helix protein, CopG family [Acidimicrobiia bacterium]